MNTYSREFFNKKFTENKNSFKLNDVKNQVKNQTEQASFKVEKIEKIEDVENNRKKRREKTEEYKPSIMKLFKSRVSTLGEYFYQWATKIFSEEAV